MQYGCGKGASGRGTKGGAAGNATGPARPVQILTPSHLEQPLPRLLVAWRRGRFSRLHLLLAGLHYYIWCGLLSSGWAAGLGRMWLGRAATVGRWGIGGRRPCRGIRVAALCCRLGWLRRRSRLDGAGPAHGETATALPTLSSKGGGGHAACVKPQLIRSLGHRLPHRLLSPSGAWPAFSLRFRPRPRRI